MQGPSRGPCRARVSTFPGDWTRGGQIVHSPVPRRSPGRLTHSHDDRHCGTDPLPAVPLPKFSSTVPTSPERAAALPEAGRRALPPLGASRSKLQSWDSGLCSLVLAADIPVGRPDAPAGSAAAVSLAHSGSARIATDWSSSAEPRCRHGGSCAPGARKHSSGAARREGERCYPPNASEIRPSSGIGFIPPARWESTRLGSLTETFLGLRSGRCAVSAPGAESAGAPAQASAG